MMDNHYFFIDNVLISELFCVVIILIHICVTKLIGCITICLVNSLILITKKTNKQNKYFK